VSKELTGGRNVKGETRRSKARRKNACLKYVRRGGRETEIGKSEDPVPGQVENFIGKLEKMCQGCRNFDVSKREKSGLYKPGP